MITFRKQMSDFEKSKTRLSKLFTRRRTTQDGVPELRDFKLCANYETMFSDTRPRVEMKTAGSKPLGSTGVVKTVPKEIHDLKEMMEIQGSHRTLFYRQPSKKHVSTYATVVVDLEESTKKVSFGSESDADVAKPAVVITLPTKAEKMETKGTQTDYRESEAQTLPWKHEIRAEGKILAELMTLEWFSLERNLPLGMEEATLIEKSREKLAWENVVARLRGRENEGKRRALVSRMAAAESEFREGKLDEVHRERIELSRERLKEARERFEERLAVRLQRSYGVRRKENDKQIDYWKHQMSRKLRKIKSARTPPPRRGDIIAAHLDKTSEIYAPLLRNGENPAHGHEVINIQCRYLKRFHGLEILEKYIANILKPQFFRFDYGFDSKPKTRNPCPRKYRERVIEESEERKFDGLTFKVRIPAPPPTPRPDPTPRVARSRTDSEEDLYQASLLLGKVIKGRAIQTGKFLQFFEMTSK